MIFDRNLSILKKNFSSSSTVLFPAGFPGAVKVTVTSKEMKPVEVELKVFA